MSNNFSKNYEKCHKCGALNWKEIFQCFIVSLRECFSQCSPAPPAPPAVPGPRTALSCRVPMPCGGQGLLDQPPRPAQPFWSFASRSCRGCRGCPLVGADRWEWEGKGAARYGPNQDCPCPCAAQTRAPEPGSWQRQLPAVFCPASCLVARGA